MNAKKKAILVVGAIAITMSGLTLSVFPNDLPKLLPCSLEPGIPEADALLAHQTIGQIYNQSEVVVIGTISESHPCQKEQIVTRMTVQVEEYLKNPLDTNSITLESRGGEIPGVGGMWVEDEKIFEEGDRLLLFLYGSDGGVYKINPFSVLIRNADNSGMDLVKGIELRADNNRIEISKGESGNVSLLLDSFFGYGENTPIRVSGFTTYDSETEESVLYENPDDLEKFGLHIEPIFISPNINGTRSFELSIKVDANATEGKYFVNLIAQDPDQAGSIKSTSWKTASKQIQVTVENEG